jgi:hypothetical protein
LLQTPISSERSKSNPARLLCFLHLQVLAHLGIEQFHRMYGFMRRESLWVGEQLPGVGYFGLLSKPLSQLNAFFMALALS